MTRYAIPDSQGRWFWSTVLDDVAPAAATVTRLAASNARRIIWGFVWYYHASGDGATRVLRNMIRNPGLGLPTGMTQGANTRPWLSRADVTLTANQEGTIYAMGKRSGGDGFHSDVDNGTISVADASTLPIPFPLMVEENDLADLEFIVTDGHANDRNSAHILIEEWIAG